MMRLWKEEYSRPDRRLGGTATSVVVHATLITLAVIATNPPAGMIASLYGLANKVIYIAPPPRVPSAEESMEQLRYVDAAPEGLGAGIANDVVAGLEGVRKSVEFSPNPGDLGTERVAAAESRRFASYDTVFTIAQVDSAVAIDPMSAAPAYPAALLKLGVEGSAMVRYVVDTLGKADLATFQVVRATRIEFAMAVRDALPGMRFSPARMGEKAVPQLVEQPFNFRITKPDTAAVAKPPA